MTRSIWLAIAAFVTALLVPVATPARARSKSKKEDISSFLEWGTEAGDRKIYADADDVTLERRINAIAFAGKRGMIFTVVSVVDDTITAQDLLYVHERKPGRPHLSNTTYGGQEQIIEWRVARKARRTRMRVGSTRRIKTRGRLFINGEKRGTAKLVGKFTYAGREPLAQRFWDFEETVRTTSESTLTLKDKTTGEVVEVDSLTTSWSADGWGAVRIEASSEARRDGEIVRTTPLSRLDFATGVFGGEPTN